MSVHQTKTGIWYCQYRIPGKKSPKKEYFGKDSEAKRRATIRDAEINLYRAKGLELRDPSYVYSDRLAQLYLDDCRIRGASETFIKEFKSLMNKKVLPKIAHIPVDKLTYSDIVNVVQECWPDRSPATRQRYMEYLRTMYRFGINHDLTKNSPLSKWKKVKEKRREMRLTVDDLTKILKHSPPHLAWIIEVEWELGARPGPTELFSIQWRDIDFSAGTIHIRGSKTETSDRVVPLTERFLTRLAEKKKESRTEFVIEFKGKRVVNNVLKSLKTACAAAEIPYPVRLYDIRHLFASTMLSGGADLAAVSRLLGHADITTTQKHYYHLMKGEMARATAIRPTLEESSEKPSPTKVLRFKKQ